MTMGRNILRNGCKLSHRCEVCIHLPGGDALQKTGIVDIVLADSMPDGWKLWLEWLRAIAPENHLEIQSLEADAGRQLTYNRVVARRRAHIHLDDPIESIPSDYARKPLHRSQKH